jgi:hypothetical protein
MKLRTSVPLLLAALALAGPARAGNYMGAVWNSRNDGPTNGAYYAREAPNLVGPYGMPIQAVAPASYHEPTGADYARYALAQSTSPEMLMLANFYQQQQYGIQAAAYPGNCGPNGCGPMMPPGPGYGMPGPGNGMPPGPGYPMPPGPGNGMPPAAYGGAPMPPGGPGFNGAYNGPPGAVAAVGTVDGPGGLGGGPGGVSRTEIRFVGPAGMQISWYAPRADGKAGFTTQYLEAPARYNFLQASIYRLKLGSIPGRPGLELYPTLEVMPCNAKTATFLAHSAVPINFTEEDFEQVMAGNFIVKVIYLPDPQFQDLAAMGPNEVVSSRLEPGVDPLVEAKRRGSILAVVRLGDIDLEAPNTPAMDAPPRMPHGPGPGNGPGPANNGGPVLNGPINNQPNNTGLAPIVPVVPLQVPVKTDAVPSAPTVPPPLAPDVKAPATPLGQLPTTGQVQPASATQAPAPVKPPQRTTLLDLLGKPTTSR